MHHFRLITLNRTSASSWRQGFFLDAFFFLSWSLKAYCCAVEGVLLCSSSKDIHIICALMFNLVLNCEFLAPIMPHVEKYQVCI